jgi:hypothetical protein
MNTGILHAHNGFRWLVLLALIFSIGMAFSGWFSKREWKKSDNIAGLILTIVADIQFLLGIALYGFLSPLTKAAFRDFGAAMKNEVLRFYAVEHILIMVIALILIHIGRARTKKAGSAIAKHRAAAIFFTLAFLLILAGIPWDRAMF